jgi:hypothetical protein
MNRTRNKQAFYPQSSVRAGYLQRWAEAVSAGHIRAGFLGAKGGELGRRFRRL